MHKYKDYDFRNETGTWIEGIVDQKTESPGFTGNVVPQEEAQETMGIEYENPLEEFLYEKTPGKENQRAKNEAYWLKKLSGDLHRTGIPYDYREYRPNGNQRRMESLAYAIPRDPGLKLLKSCDGSDLKLYKVLVSVLVVLLDRYTYTTAETRDIIMATPVLNSHIPMKTGVIDTKPVMILRNQIHDCATFKEFYRQVSDTVDEAIEHSDYPFEDLQKHLNLNQPPGGGDFSLPDVGVSLENLQDKQHLRHIDADVIFSFLKTGGTFEGTLEYNSSLYEKRTVEGLADHFINLLHSALSDTVESIKLSGIDMLSTDEKIRLLYDFNDTERPYPKDKTIHELFEEQVEKTPDHIALYGCMMAWMHGEEGYITYKELNEDSGRLAHMLIGKGVRQDNIVGLMMERSIEMIVGILAILKAGGAYLPIDPDYPGDRINYLLRDSNSKVLATSRNLFEKRKIGGWKFGKNFEVILLNSSNFVNTASSLLPLCPISHPTNLAYVIYTSGSTGKPKGVLVEHLSVVNLAFAQKKQFNINSEDRVLQFSSICFDASVEQIFIALSSGAGLILIDKETLLDIRQFDTFVSSHRITHIHAVPSFLGNMSLSNISGLKRVIAGGDICPVELAKKWSRYGDFYNEYGPTETTVTSIEMQAKAVDEMAAALPIGKPILNTVVYLFDRWLNLVPIGVVGEIHIGGAGIARGYLNRPELTAEKFCLRRPGTFLKKGSWTSKNFLLNSPEGRHHLTLNTQHLTLYKTGDLARWLPDGNIEFLGRIDYQVKVRGFRIELGEIENQLLAIEDIKEAVVLAQGDENGNKYLCAYFVAYKPIDISALRDKLSKSLPDYMIPSYFLQITKIPLTPNGKLDRKALPDPTLMAKKEKHASPRDKIEKKLLDIWSEILRVNKNNTGIDDNFFNLGGHSLKAALMITIIHRQFDIKMTIHQVSEMPTIRKLAEYIRGAKKEVYSSITLAEEKEYYPQTSAQKRLYFIEQLENTGILYNIPMMDIYCKGMKKPNLEKAFQRLIERHEALRTSFFVVDGEAVQGIHDAEEVISNFSIEYYEATEEGLIYTDRTGKTGTKSPIAFTDVPFQGFQDVVELFIRPFDLAKPPLLRVGLVKILGNTQVLMMDMHHIITDGTSSTILLEELWQSYDEEELQPLSIRYKDYAGWLTRETQTGQIEMQETFWLKEFPGEIPVLNLPTDYPTPIQSTYDGNILYFEIGKEETQQLKEAAQEQGANLYVVLLALYHVLLAKLSGQEDIIVGTVTAGRNHADIQEIIGMFVKTLAHRSYPCGEKTFAQFLKEVQEKHHQVLENQDYPFEQLVSKVARNQERNRHSLFNTVFVLQNEAERTNRYLLEVLMLAKSNPYLLKIKKSKFDMTFMGVETGDGLEFTVEYNVRLFKEKTIARYIEGYKKIVASVCGDMGKKISQIEIIPDQDKARVLYLFNDTQTPYPKNKTIHELFEEQAIKTPGNIALVGASLGDGLGVDKKALTYKELNARANRLARLLRAEGLKTEHIAAIIVEPSVEMIIGMLSVLKAGGAFLPIDHKIPKERVQYMLEESGVGLFLSRSELVEGMNFKGGIIELDEPGIYSGDDSSPGSVDKPDHLAYVIFTSGSTGKPKGVLCEHRPLINLCYWYNRYFSITPNDRATKYASMGFDASVWEIFPHLLIGSSLYIMPEEIKLDITALNRYFETNGITVTFLPTQLAEQFMNIENNSLRVLQTAGDKLNSFVKKNYRLYNCYGPTENTVCATSYPVAEYSSNIPIGSPIANNRLYILDRDDNLQPIGIPGELCIGGDSLARGYLNNPELTAEKFCLRRPGTFLKKGSWTSKNFLLNSPEGRHHLTLNTQHLTLYKTGDLSRWLPDGNIEFLGRIDHQVKIRGFRIELGEIENRIRQIEGIKEAVVIAREDTPGNKYLCAYLVPGKPIDIPSLKEKLSKDLPDYMIPAHFVRLEEIPINSNGKIDRKRLPMPEIKSTAYIAPTNEIEQALADIWSEVLGIEKIGIDDHFFEIGGDSIKTILISSRLQKQQLNVQVNDFFLYPTIRQLASQVTKIQRLIQQETVTGEVELTPIQQWFFQNHLPYCHHFNQSVILYREKGFDEDLIRKVFTRIVEHHDALRMVYRFEGDKVIQIDRDIEGKLFDLEAIRLTGKEKEEMEEEIKTESARIQQSLDIQKGPLVKLGLFEGIGGDHLLIVIHHLVVDGVSWRILLEDFESGYRQATEGKPIEFQEKTDSYRYWAKKLKEYSIGKNLSKESAYWKTIEDSTVKNLPVDHDITKEQRKLKYTDIVPIELTEEKTGQLLTKVNWAYHTEINDILLTALGLTIEEWGGPEKVLINLEGHGREMIMTDVDIQRTVGWFTTQYPVILDMEGAHDLSYTIRNVKETLRKVPHKGIGYGILKYLTPAEKKKSLLFKHKPEIVFNYLGTFGGEKSALLDRISGITDLSSSDSISPEFKYDHKVDIEGVVDDSRLKLFVFYNTLEYERTTMETFAGKLKTNLEKVIAHCIEKREEILNLGYKTALDYHVRQDYDRYLDRVNREEWPDLTVKNDYRHILLTGSTGFLGAHLVPELLDNTKAVLYLPVRGTTQAEAEARFKKKMSFYHGQGFFNTHRERFVVLKSDLGEERLGMEKDRHEKLCDTVEAVVHPAANVKHQGLYEEFFKDNVLATEHLLEFAETNKKKDFHYISTPSIGEGNIPGRDYLLFTEYCLDMDMEIDHVYLKSKYEAEKRVIAYRKRGINGCIYRVGNLIFHSGTGKFQENIGDDYFYNIIKGAIKLEMLSNQMKHMVFDMSFIDYTAKAVVLLLSRKGLENQTYHMLNPYSIAMPDLAQILEEMGYRFNEVEEGREKEYLARFEGNSEYERIIELLRLHSRLFEEKKGTKTVYKMERTGILYKNLGLEWPKTTKELIEKMIAYCREVKFI